MNAPSVAEIVALEPAVRRMVGRMIPCEHVDDVVQETIIAAWRGRGKWQRRGKLSTWVMGIAYHKARDEQRLWIKHRRCLERAVSLGMLKAAPVQLDADAVFLDDEPGPPNEERPTEDDLIDGEASARVWAALRSLPERYGEYLTLRYIDGLPVEDAAQVAGVSFKSMESCLVRARTAFRERYAANTERGNGDDYDC